MKRSHWPRVAISDVCESVIDCVNKTAPTVEYETPFKMIRTTNVRNGWINLEEVRYVSEATYRIWTRRQVPKRGDVILTREAPLGEVGILRTDETVFLGQRLVSYRVDDSKLDNLFLLYSFLCDDLKGQIRALGAGATVEHMRVPDAERLTLRLPPLDIQRRIAAILSAYDDLIENNSRRIKILESQCDLIFKHCSIAFGRTGKESKLGEICDKIGGVIRTGPFGSQLHESDYDQHGIPVVMPKNIVGGRIVTRDIARVPESIAERLAQHALLPGDIVYGRRGDIGRRALVTRRQQGWLCGTGCLRISLKGETLHPRYLYEYLGTPDVIKTIAARAVGSTMLNLNTGILRDVEIPVPPFREQLAFAELVEPMDELIETLDAQSGILRQTRDLLLPKLISGEIDVSSLPDPS